MGKPFRHCYQSQWSCNARVVLVVPSGLDGQFDRREGRRGRVIERQFTAMPKHDIAGDRQAKAGAAGFAIA